MVLSHFRLQDELTRIPLAGIEAILLRNDLGVASEVLVYDFLLRWAFSQYPNSEERHKILSSRLLPLVPLVRYTSDAIVDQPCCWVSLSVKTVRSAPGSSRRDGYAHGRSAARGMAYASRRIVAWSRPTVLACL